VHCNWVFTDVTALNAIDNVAMLLAAVFWVFFWSGNAGSQAQMGLRLSALVSVSATHREAHESLNHYVCSVTL